MSLPVTLLAASATIERVVWVIVLLTVALLCLGSRRRLGGSLALDVDTERVAMAIIVVWVLLSRLLAYASPRQPRLYWSEVGPLHITDWLGAPGLAGRWLGQLANVQVIYEHQSPLMAPVAAAMQLALGPSIELPACIGAVWAVLAVVLAWRLGRSAESSTFGVLFSALLAASPLQLTWSRLGGIYIGSPAHVLLVLWCGWIVGSRRGIIAALGLGVLAWCSMYHYLAARIALPLAPIALWTGWRSSDRELGRLGTLLAAVTLGIALCAAAHHLANPGQPLWPAYSGYVGNRNESGSLDWLTSMAVAIRTQGAKSLREYFWADRMGTLPRLLAPTSSPTGTLREAGMAGGGLVLLPVFLLGIVGLARCLRRPVRNCLWLSFAVLGLLVPILSVPSARRFLLFDAAWCAFAAFGLLSLLQSRLLDHLTARMRWCAATALIAALALWGAGAVALSSAALPPNRTTIPFAESGFGDGLTCLGCVRSARSWQHELEDGRMVILFDSDLEREDRTAPGGLWLYGRLVALTAGHEDRFLEYYPIVSNFDHEQPRPGFRGPVPPADIAGEIGRRVAAVHPRSIVWWFTQPTAWERTLARSLAEAGGSWTNPDVPSTALADHPSAMGATAIRVETPAQRWSEALATLRAFTDAPPAIGCIRLSEVSARQVSRRPLLIAPIPDSDNGPPDWVSTSWDGVEISGVQEPVPSPMGIDRRREPDGVDRVYVVDPWGRRRSLPPSIPAVDVQPLAGPWPLARSCVTHTVDGWWRIDPVAGLVRDPAGHVVLPELGLAVGLVPYGDALVVATSDQQLHIVDPSTLTVVRSFPASVVPPIRTQYGECAMLAAGRGWIASLDQLRGLVAFYDAESGMLLGRASLTGAARSTPLGLQDMRGLGDYLGVAHDSAITTLRVERDATCAGDAGTRSRLTASP